MATEFLINSQAVSSDAPTATPLLWVIREQLKLTGTKFGWRRPIRRLHGAYRRQTRILMPDPACRRRRQGRNDN